MSFYIKVNLLLFFKPSWWPCVAGEATAKAIVWDFQVQFEGLSLIVVYYMAIVWPEMIEVEVVKSPVMHTLLKFGRIQP